MTVSRFSLPHRLEIRNGILIAEGYGLRTAVERGHLLVEDGICENRRRRRFAKATARLKRLVVLGHTGFITLEALRWLKDVGAAFVQIDADGQVVVASGPAGLDDARLRRTQALAVTNGTGIKIARELVRRKLEGQLAVLTHLPDGPLGAGAIQRSLAGLDRAETQAQLQLLESAAAAAYWKAWESIPVRFVRRDEPRVPDHWRTVGTRGSRFGNGPRLAANPASAILNYLYAILEGEARIAALAIGLDPGMGVLHADQPARDSLALDLIEVVRPEVDAYVIELLQRQAFRASDFFETRQGVCRLLPPLARLLCGTAVQWAQRVAPVTEWVAQMLAATPSSQIRRLPTPLTQARRSAGRAEQRRQQPREPRPPRPTPVAACRVCGVILPSANRSYCDECRPTVKAEGLEAWKASGPAALSQLMREGRDPTHGGVAANRRAASLARRRQEAADWERINRRPDPAEFTQTILPSLQDVPLSRMVDVTGLTVRYCSLIRRGLRPAPEALGGLQIASSFGGESPWRQDLRIDGSVNDRDRKLAEVAHPKRYLPGRLARRGEPSFHPDEPFTRDDLTNALKTFRRGGHKGRRRKRRNRGSGV